MDGANATKVRISVTKANFELSIYWGNQIQRTVKQLRPGESSIVDLEVTPGIHILTFCGVLLSNKGEFAYDIKVNGRDFASFDDDVVANPGIGLFRSYVIQNL